MTSTMHAEMDHMIQLRSVSKRFGAGRLVDRAPRAVEALREVSLDVRRGEVCAVVGPNGAGKTTLLALLLGFLRPTAGTITIEGDDARDYVRRTGAGYLPEQFRLPPEWRVRDALRTLARLDGPATGARTRADAALERYGLTREANRELGGLSRGTLQRVGLAQAFQTQRALLVLDEPTEGLDPLWRVRFRDAIAVARDAGATVVLASHDLAEVERIADRALLIEAGTVRQVLETRTTGSQLAYVIRLEKPAPLLADLFADAVTLDDDGRVYGVAVASAAELSSRLGALLDTGALLRSVEPVQEPLEERVRRALGGES
ncbi:MAG: ABC transporter ATP-binding protein [Longimicrobiales bacterium]